MQTLAELKGIHKSFPGVKALNDVSLEIKAGEVHVLVGENGAGKSTLAKVLLGVIKPDKGKILYKNEEMKFDNPKDAIKRGITAVYQELTMVPHLDAAQNIFLNREPKKPGTFLIDKKKMYNNARKLLDSLNCSYIDIKKHTKYLSVAEQQMVEIAKALSYNPNIIVFDEPTATLSEKDVSSLFDRIGDLKKKGIGIVYVSHRMKELPIIGDRVTILRDGNHISTLKIDDINEEQLVNMMVGRDINQVFHRNQNIRDEEVLRVEEVCDKHDRVKKCSINLKKGEIIGIAGLVGAGRTELARLIYGIDTIKSGEIFVHGKKIDKPTTISMAKLGFGMLPEDRKRIGLALDAPISWNTVAVSLKRICSKLLISKRKLNKEAEKYVEELRIATPDVIRNVKSLSGGNQQKVVIAKWLSANSDILIFDEPTRGIDVGAKLEIYALMDKLADQGKSIIMISSELPEIMGMTDRMYIMNEGTIVAEFDRNDYDTSKIGTYMLGLGVS